jgi:glycosyltransferase involved in cell wall biosynthesis
MSTIAASACEKPVIVSDVSRLAEIEENRVSGSVVPPGDPQKITKAIEVVLIR